VVNAKAVEKALDWRNLRLLDQFISPLGRIQPKRTNRIPRRLQRKVAKQIKVARQMGLMSYSQKLPGFQKEYGGYTSASGAR
jgi:small subunit ribosomal protein S18